MYKLFIKGCRNMTKRTKENLQVTLVVMIVAVLIVFAVQAIWVGFNFMMFRVDIVEHGLYEEASAARETFYNSENLFINWLSNMTNEVVRIPVLLLFSFAPVIFLWGVRKYNLSKKETKRARMN